MEWFLKVVKDNYANFNGRARRKEFWIFQLYYFILLFVLRFFDVMISYYYSDYRIGLLSSILSLALIIPIITVAVRRLHDTNKSGLWLLVILVPIVGFLILLLFFCLNGNDKENKYGENPKTKA